MKSKMKYYFVKRYNNRYYKKKKYDKISIRDYAFFIREGFVWKKIN